MAMLVTAWQEKFLLHLTSPPRSKSQPGLWSKGWRSPQQGRPLRAGELGGIGVELELEAEIASQTGVTSMERSLLSDWKVPVYM